MADEYGYSSETALEAVHLKHEQMHDGDGESGEMKQQVLGWIGIVLHCTYVALHYYLSLLLVPPWAAYILWGVWAVFLVLAVYLLHRRTAWALAVPFLAMAVWYGAIALGSELMGWTA